MLYWTQKSCSVLGYLLSEAEVVQLLSVGLLLPTCRHNWCGKEGKKMSPGNSSLQFNCCLNDQPEPQSLKHVCLHPCTANQCKQYLLSSVWWNRANESGGVETVIVPPAQTGRCGCAVTGGAKPEAFCSKKKKIFQETQWQWNCIRIGNVDEREADSMNFFSYLTLQIMWAFHVD